jgi:hypothetical protein
MLTQALALMLILPRKLLQYLLPQVSAWQALPTSDTDPDAVDLAGLATKTNQFLVRYLPGLLFYVCPSLLMMCPCGFQGLVNKARRLLSERDSHAVLRQLQAANDVYPGDLEATILKVTVCPPVSYAYVV